ncbi:MAG: TIGR03790 family protein [Planctomycetes bacterium]|nr:TIGR03790 family protein [Planctomycetota bacterium]
MRAILGMLLLALAAPLLAIDASNVLIVANEKAEGSVDIANYYSEMRGVPADQILKISASENEEITRDEFNKDIWGPVQKYVLAHDNILVIVPTRGVPLKVKQLATGPKEAFKGRDFASVDGELALVRFGDYDIDGIVENPTLDSKEHYTLESKIVVVCRLDGPTVEIAKGLVEKALISEALGCHGESFLDTRGLTKDDGYTQRDDIMEKVEDSWKAAGLPYVHDTKGPVFDLSERAETLHYYGWYAGNPGAWKGDVKFRTGGICVHLHSFSGSTVRNIKANWVAPLLNWNATATYGTTYEPYTTGFPYEHIFWDRLVNGWCFGEAGQVANHLLSWQAVFCGDPLYTPYADGYVELHKRYHDALIARLVPNKDAPTPIDETGLGLLASVQKLLQARADGIKELLRKDPKAALDAFNDLRFLVSDMELGGWLSELSGPFNAELERRFSAIKSQIKEDLTDTAEFERALVDWKGLPIYEDLEKYRLELVEDQEKAASKLVKKAESYQKSKRWLKAWSEASQAAAHKFAQSAVDAQKILSELKADADALKEMKEDSDKELAPLVERAQKDLDKNKPDRALKTLGTDWRWCYPESDQYKAAEALAKKIEEALAKDS